MYTDFIAFLYNSRWSAGKSWTLVPTRALHSKASSQLGYTSVPCTTGHCPLLVSVPWARQVRLWMAPCPRLGVFCRIEDADGKGGLLAQPLPGQSSGILLVLGATESERQYYVLRQGPRQLAAATAAVPVLSIVPSLLCPPSLTPRARCSSPGKPGGRGIVSSPEGAREPLRAPTVSGASPRPHLPWASPS